MPQAERDEERDECIETQTTVDTYGAEEQAIGWHAYLDDTMDSPFEARCIVEQAESPLNVGETVRVIEMFPTGPTFSQTFVTMEWMDRTLDMPLERLEPVDASNNAEQAIADWQYWLDH